MTHNSSSGQVTLTYQHEPGSVRDAVKLYQEILKQNPDMPVTTMLPLFFNFQGKPYSIDRGHFPFEPQFRMARVPQRQILKCGRQVGKCCVASTYITLDNCKPITIEDLVVGQKVISMGPDFKTRTQRVINKFDNGSRETFRVTTRLGAVVQVTSNHRFRTLYGYTEVKDLKVGSRVAHLQAGGVFKDVPLEEARIKYTAYMIGDGCTTEKAVSFTAVPGPVLDEFLSICTAIQGLTLSGTKSGTHARSVYIRRNSPLRDWLQEDGLIGCYSETKFLPGWVYDLSRKDTALFLSRLWSTDGTVNSRGGFPEVGYTSVSRVLAKGVQSLLAKFGILSSCKVRKTACNGKAGQPAFNVRVEGYDSIQKFFAEIEVPGKPPIGNFSYTRNSNRDSIPIEVREVIARLSGGVAHKHTSSFRSVGLRVRPKYALSRAKLARYIEHLSNKTNTSSDLRFLSALASRDIMWDTVESVEPCGVERVYDIEVEEDHNFIADGIVSHNSLSTAATGILRGAMTPYFQHLTVTPLFEQVRKFSSNYVKPFLKECSFRSSIIAPGTDNSVLQRSLSNGSNLFYNYASNSADRIRGTPADEVDCDEMQDFDLTVLPVIESCLGASKHKILRFSGTPKTFDGPLQVYWNKSSQAIWHIPCMTLGCNTVNKCSAYDGHLVKMIDNAKTLVCHQCAQPLNSRMGYYVHTYPDRQLTFPGYHMPQVIFPMHYEDPKAWHLIQQSLKEKPKYIIWNELLGESIDTGMKLLTLEELQKVSRLPVEVPNVFTAGRYIKTALGVDWGGKGKERVQDKDDFISNTALALAGIRSDGVIEIRWLWKTPYEANSVAEAKMVLDAASDGKVDWLAHDFGGAGNVREDIMLGSGYPVGKIAPFTYSIMSPNKPIVFYEAAGTRGVRSSWTLDKTRAISLFCELVKREKILFPEYEGSRDFLQDFFNIYEQTNESPRGKVKIIQKVPHQTDDIVHACVFAAMALYNSTAWPVLADSFQPQIDHYQQWDAGDL